MKVFKGLVNGVNYKAIGFDTTMDMLKVVALQYDRTLTEVIEYYNTTFDGQRKENVRHYMYDFMPDFFDQARANPDKGLPFSIFGLSTHPIYLSLEKLQCGTPPFILTFLHEIGHLKFGLSEEIADIFALENLHRFSYYEL